MARSTRTRIANVETLAQSFARHLHAGNRSPKTVMSYLESVNQFDAFLADRGMPQDVASIRREHLESYIEDILARFKATTAVVRFKSLQQFFRWLLEEGEITESPTARPAERSPRASGGPDPTGGPVAPQSLRGRRLRGPARRRDHLPCSPTLGLASRSS